MGSIRLLIVLACLLFTACSSTLSNSGVNYQTYAYNCCAEITEITVWHPGEHVTLHWQSQVSGSTTDPTPVSEKLSLVLTGPFASVDALKTATSQHRLPAGVRSIAAPVPTVTDRTGGTPATELDLPSNLPTGYYNLEQSISIGANSASGGTIITVQ